MATELTPAGAPAELQERALRQLWLHSPRMGGYPIRRIEQLTGLHAREPAL